MCLSQNQLLHNKLCVKESVRTFCPIKCGTSSVEKMALQIRNSQRHSNTHNLGLPTLFIYFFYFSHMTNTIDLVPHPVNLKPATKYLGLGGFQWLVRD